MNFRLLLITLTLIASEIVKANSYDSLYTDNINTPPRRLGIKVLPNGYYRPETSIAIGGFSLITFRPNLTDSVSRSSFIKSTFVVTLNKQFTIENKWVIFLKKESIGLYGNLDYMLFPELFYGIGPDTPKDSSELLHLNRISHNSLVLKKLKGFYFAGLNFDTHYLYGGDPNYQLNRYSEVVGATGYFVNGIGPTFLFDSRDNGLISRKGWYNEITINFHGKGTFSDYTFTNFQANARKFIPLFKKKCTWANEVYVNFNTGTVPFRSNPAVGGLRFLRGYYTGRFREKNFAFCQTEIRIPLFWKLGFVAFAGMGELAPDLKSFAFNKIKYTGGGGFRFFLSKKENASLRVDYGFTREGGGLYMVFGEAF